MPPVARYTATALGLALTAGSGLGVWLLLARTFEVPLGGASWLALVQVHGFLQLFGFAGLFLMGVGMHLLPRLRGAPQVGRGRSSVIFVSALAGLAMRAVAQPAPGLPGRELVLASGAVLLVFGASLFAFTAIGVLRSGDNPHRADELVIGAGVAVFPVAALLAAIAVGDGWPLVVSPGAEDRATWMMLLGCLVTAITGVWARLAPGFVAAPPYRPRHLLAAATTWLVGVCAFVLGSPVGAPLMLAGLLALVLTLGVWGPAIAQQQLAGHARLTRFAVRSAFAWGLVGAAVLALAPTSVLPGTQFLVGSAARHAFALGLVTLMIYGVAARALPSFLGRKLWKPPLHAFAVVSTNVAVALRVVPQVLGLEGGVANAAVAFSGVLAYVALAAFALNLVRTLRRGEPLRPAQPGASRLILVQPRVQRGPEAERVER